MNVQKSLIWIGGFFFIVILADYYPRIAKGLVFLLVFSVLLIHWQDYSNIFSAYVKLGSSGTTSYPTGTPNISNLQSQQNRIAGLPANQ